MQRSFYLIVLAVIMISATPMLVRHSRRQQRLSGANQYSSFSVNVIVEFTKAVMTLAALAWQYLYQCTSPSSTTSTVSSGVYITPMRRFLVLFTFCIPAFLYAVDNNIFFLVMSLINPQTFHLFNNIKIVFVAVLCRVFLNKLLSNIQWSSLAMLLVGLLVSELDVLVILLRSPQQTVAVSNSSDESIWVAFGLVCLMALCSSVANIYLEHVYKTAGGVLLHQNLQLYLYGTVFNLIGFVLATNGAYGGDFAVGAARHGNLQGVGFFDGYSPLVWLVVIFNALTGIVISMILKYTDNITNVWAHAAALVVTAIASMLIFSARISLAFVCGSVLVTLSAYVYQKDFAIISSDSNTTLMTSETNFIRPRVRSGSPRSNAGHVYVSVPTVVLDHDTTDGDNGEFQQDPRATLEIGSITHKPLDR